MRETTHWPRILLVGDLHRTADIDKIEEAALKLYFVNRKYPQKASRFTHHLVGTFADPCCRMSACFIR